MPRKGPFDVTLTDAQKRELTTLLVEAIRTGLQARDRVMGDNGLIDFAYSLYEQERQAGTFRDMRPGGGADLTSPIGTEAVDALGARAVKTIFVEPLWIVEGIGESAQRAPVVEEFMQWRHERMRLQQTAGKWFKAALIEEGAVLEVCEDTEPIMCTEVTKAAIARNADDIEQDPRGSVIVNEKGEPVPQRDEKGALVPATDGDDYVEVKREYQDYRRRGASLRLHSMKDVLFLPGHWKDESEVYGQAFRFWRRHDQLEEDVDNDVYDAAAVEALGQSQERDTRPEHTRANQDVEVDHSGKYTDAELWRVQVLANLDGNGYSFYVITISVIHEQILRIRKDWLSRWRGVYANPYPRTYSGYGYSLVLHKLLTTIEEHTAWRNMNADVATLKANTPHKVLQTESWDPELQPFGTGQAIRVSSMDGIQPFEVADLSQGALDRERTCVLDYQRIVGLNDIGIGQLSRTDRTLGENQMATRESYARTDDPIGNLQEAMEEVGELIHAIEVKTLEEMEHGLAAPASVAENVKQRGSSDFDGTFTADMIRGTFRFKPRGSVESADPHRRQQQMVNGLTLLNQWARVNPMLAQRLSSPEMADALMQWWVTEFKPRDKQAFLAPMQQPMLPAGAAGPGGPPNNVIPFPGGSPGSPFGAEQLLSQLTGQLPPGGGPQ